MTTKTKPKPKRKTRDEIKAEVNAHFGGSIDQRIDAATQRNGTGAVRGSPDPAQKRPTVSQWNPAWSGDPRTALSNPITEIPLALLVRHPKNRHPTAAAIPGS